MRFVFQQWIDAPREVVFAFFRNPRCLPLLHVKEKHIHVLRHESDVRVGAETWAEVTVLGMLPVILGFRHELFEPPARFGESLIHGPFTKFRHVHAFRECLGGTEITDELEVELPWHYGGEMGVRFLVAPGMTRSFAARRRELIELAKGGELPRRAAENLELLEAL
jgi:ligand-binding SRPBCC domain-containing protein